MAVVHEDREAAPRWVREGSRVYGTHWAFIAVVVIVVLATWSFFLYDYLIASAYGLAVLDQTIQAQAESVIAAAAIIGGAYAVWKFLTPGPNQG